MMSIERYQDAVIDGLKALGHSETALNSSPLLESAIPHCFMKGAKIDRVVRSLHSRLRESCAHNAMVPNDSATHAWKCADCGHVYGAVS